MFRFVFSPPATESNKGMPNLDPEVLGNYRPVSNLPYLSKILERAVADQLQAHLDTKGLHVKFQRRTDVVIAPRRPSFAYLTICW